MREVIVEIKCPKESSASPSNSVPCFVDEEDVESSPMVLVSLSSLHCLKDFHDGLAAKYDFLSDSAANASRDYLRELQHLRCCLLSGTGSMPHSAKHTSYVSTAYEKALHEAEVYFYKDTSVMSDSQKAFTKEVVMRMHSSLIAEMNRMQIALEELGSDGMCRTFSPVGIAKHFVGILRHRLRVPYSVIRDALDEAAGKRSRTEVATQTIVPPSMNPPKLESHAPERPKRSRSMTVGRLPSMVVRSNTEAPLRSPVRAVERMISTSRVTNCVVARSDFGTLYKPSLTLGLVAAVSKRCEPCASIGVQACLAPSLSVGFSHTFSRDAEQPVMHYASTSIVRNVSESVEAKMIPIVRPARTQSRAPCPGRRSCHQVDSGVSQFSAIQGHEPGGSDPERVLIETIDEQREHRRLSPNRTADRHSSTDLKPLAINVCADVSERRSSTATKRVTRCGLPSVRSVGSNEGLMYIEGEKAPQTSCGGRGI